MIPTIICKTTGRTVFDTNQKEYLYFAGTSYLGMNFDLDFKKYFEQGVRLYGLSYGNSRYGNIRLDISTKAEEVFENMVQAPNALWFSSGYLAAQSALFMLINKDTQIFASPFCHPAILPQNHKAFNGSFEEWIVFLKKQSFTENTLLLSNTIDNKTGQQIPLELLINLNSPKKIRLLIDESHSLGIMGKKGEGYYSSLKNYLSGFEILAISSLHKAMGILGGAIYGENIENIRQGAFINGASVISPVYAYAFIKSQQLYSENRKKLQQNINILREANLSFISHSNALHPVFIINNTDKNLYEYLKNKGILVSAFSYPTNCSPIKIRIVLNALHTFADIQKLINILKLYFKL